MTSIRAWITTVVFVIAVVSLFGCATNQVRPAQVAVAHYTVGLNALMANKLDLAMVEFKKAIESDPNNKDAHFAAGIVYYQQNDMESAGKEFRKSISLDPGFYDAHLNIGLVHIKEKDYTEALKEFRIAEKNPNSDNPAQVLNAIGATYDLMGDSEKAVQTFRDALLVQPTNDMTMSNLAEQYYKLGNLDESIRFYEKAISLNPGNVASHYGLGLAYYKDGRNAEATASFLKVTELAPGSEMAQSSEKYIYLLK